MTDAPSDRGLMRQMLCDAWAKHKNNEALLPEEAKFIGIIEQHPEYHKILSDPKDHLSRDYLPEEGEINPFLHMALHVTILEQLESNAPAGIQDVYTQLISHFGNAHDAEHEMMSCLIEMIYQTQKEGEYPGDEAYLSALKALL